MWRASWAVGRWPWDAGRWPSSGRSGPPGSGASDRAPGSGRSPTDRGPRIVGRAHRIASPWSTDADQVHRMPTRRTGSRIPANGQGPRPIGSDRGFRLFASAPRRPAPGLDVPELGPCFSQIFTYFFVSALTALYLRLKSHTLRAMFRVKHQKLRIRN